ncbi:MAG: carboxypeptidase regulatory-like domain-containing protein [Terriglobales bacterium]|jgi:carboxypeptidase family protein
MGQRSLWALFSKGFAGACLLWITFCSFSIVSYAGDLASSAIRVVVIDEKNLPVSGAKVEVRLSGKIVSTASTDADGKVTLTVDLPGSYALNIQKKSYLPTDTVLEVNAGSTATGIDIDVVLNTVALSQQSVEVKGEASNPITETSTAPATLSPASAKETPLRPATVVDALPLIPGIVRGPDGSVRIAGFGEDHSALLINSVDVTDPATGSFGLSVPIDSVQKIEVSEMPYLAEYGRFTAGVIAADTRRGGEKWDYSLNDPFPDFFIRSGHLEGVRDAAPRFNLSGPVVANHLYFLEGAEYLLNKQEVYTLPFPQSLSTSKAFNSFTQFDAILSANQTLTGSFHFAPHSQQYVGLDYFNPQPVTPNSDVHETTVTLTDRLAIAGGFLQSTIANRVVSSGVTAQGTAEMALSPTGNSGNYFSQESRRANRFEWIEEWTPRMFQFAGQHTLKFGMVLGHSENVGNFYARPVSIDDANGQLLQQISFSGAGTFDLSDLEPAVFAQDHWTLNSHLALDFGLRVEAQTITFTSRAAPRTGFAWTPDVGKTVVRGGIGIFYDSVPLDVYAFNTYPQQTITTYNSSGVPVGPPIEYINLTSQEAQSNFPFVDRSQKSGNFAPYSVAWNLSFERVVNRFLLLRVKYLQSHEQDMITLQPEVVQNQNAFVLGAGGWARTRQAEFTARIGGVSNRQFFFSYVRQYAYGNISDANSYLGNYPFPVVRDSLIASLPSEIPNRFLLWGSYAFPRKILVTPHVEFRNGFPYQPTDVYQQYVAVSDGPQYRFPKYFSLDLRVAKDIQVDQKHAVRLSGSVRNLTNHFNPLEVHSNIADPLYGNFFGNNGRRFLLDFDVLF